VVQGTLETPASPKVLFLAADQAVRGFRERWYPSLVDWQGEPPPPAVRHILRITEHQERAEHVPRAAPST
jgi:hypothetical protein